MQILDGKTISQQMLVDLKSKIDLLGQKPTLDIILVGNDPASHKYVEMKLKKAAMVGGGEPELNEDVFMGSSITAEGIQS